MKTCEDCGSRVYSLGCVNCNEEAYIRAQERENELEEELREERRRKSDMPTLDDDGVQQTL